MTVTTKSVSIYESAKCHGRLHLRLSKKICQTLLRIALVYAMLPGGAGIHLCAVNFTLSLHIRHI